MSKRKKTLLKILISVLLLALLFWNWILLGLLNLGFYIPLLLAPGITVMDSASTYGHVIGNGNGIQFFGAALVEAKNRELLERQVAQLQESYDVVEAVKQEGDTAELPDYMVRLDFSLEGLQDGKTEYYIVYYCCSHPLSNPLDVRGH